MPPTMPTRTALALAATLALLPAAAQAGARQEATVLMPKNPQALKFHEDYGFANAVVHGDTIHLSGVVAGLPPGGTDMDKAFTLAFERIQAVLKEAGASWDDVVDMTTYHTDIPGQLDRFNAVKARYVKAPYPAWTAIGVSRLVPEGGLVEVKVTAKLPRTAG